MDENAVSAARKKLLEKFAGHGSDGRPYARPGDDDLWLCATGARVTGILPMDDGSAAIRFRFERASGWYRLEDGEREALPGKLPELAFRFIWAAASAGGYFSGTLWALWTWMNEDIPVDIYCALGEWTVMLAPGLPYRRGGVRSAALPTLAPPPSADLTETVSPGISGETPAQFPEEHPDHETIHQWIEENTAVAVALWMPGADDGDAAYVRQWIIPKHRAEDFAGMMTHRFGKPVEIMADQEAAQAHADEVILVGSGGPFDDCAGNESA